MPNSHLILLYIGMVFRDKLCFLPTFLSVFQSLYRHIQPNEDGSESDPVCRSNADDCQPAITAQYVEEFASNNTAWHEAFGPAFQILIENGYGPNDLVEAVSFTMASPSPTPSGATGISAQLFIISAAIVIFSFLY